MTVYFARHGESVSNVENVFSNTGNQHGLTEKGRGQAQVLAEKLKPLGVTKIITSTLLRARETAQIVADAFGLPVETSDAFKEFTVGTSEGKKDPLAWQECRDVERKWLIEGDLTARIAGGESFLDIQARFIPFIHELMETYGPSNEKILLVGHGGTFAVMLPEILTNIDRAFALNHPFPQASFVMAETQDGMLVCLRWGDVLVDAA